MNRTFVLKLIIILTVSMVGTVNAQVERSEQRYPNEPEALKLFENSTWQSILPYTSTKDDVERILGVAKPVRDDRFYVANLNDYLSGYQLDNGWILVVTYLGEGGIPEQFEGRVSHLTLYPPAPLVVPKLALAKSFKKYSLRENGIEKEIYFDEYGLRYKVRTDDKGTTLSIESIRYGASDRQEMSIK